MTTRAGPKPQAVLDHAADHFPERSQHLEPVLRASHRVAAVLSCLGASSACAEQRVGLDDRMIISGGHNIWPAQIEDALADHPAVVEVCVIGIPHERWGETPVAAVVLCDGASVTEEELVELTRARVGSVKKVTKVEWSSSSTRCRSRRSARSCAARSASANDDVRVSGA